jgi:hypothetical protein
MAAEDVPAEIHGFSEPGSTPTPWAAGLEQLRAADTFWLRRSVPTADHTSAIDAPATTTIEWLRGGSPVASGATYTLTSVDAGKSVGCSATATNAAGSTSSASSSVTLPATSVTLPATYNVVITIHGRGKVTAQGHTCTSSCTVAIAAGTVAAVTVSRTAGWALSSWRGDCSGRGACAVSMTSDHAITATFARVRPHATVTKATINGRSATFKFKAAGATRFECAVVRRHAKPRFSRCKSPKAYHHLARGHYTFELRAVGPGGTQRAATIRRFMI